MMNTRMSSSKVHGQSVTLTRLPDEILSKIFAFLPTTDILGSLRAVSRRFRNVGLSCVDKISMTECLLRKIVPSENDLKGLIDICPRVRSLDLSGIGNSVFLALHAINSCPMLEELIGIDFENGPVPDHLLHAFAAAGSSNNFLKRIRVHRLDFANAENRSSSRRFAQSLPTRLTHLEMVSCRRLDDDTLLEIGRRCPSLEAFEFRRMHRFCRLSDEGVCRFLRLVGRTLRSIELHGGSLTDASFVGLGKCRGLERVRVYHPWEIEPAGLTALLDLPRLRELVVKFAYKMNLGSSDYERAFSVKVRERLEVLEITRMVIDCDGLIAIARGCPGLRVLSITKDRGEEKRGEITENDLRKFVEGKTPSVYG